MQFAAWQMAHPDAEILSREDIEPTEEEQQQYQAMAQQYQAAGLPPPPMPQRFSVRTKTVKQKGKVTLCNLPPDELLISTRHNSVLLNDCPYVAHVCRKTLSELLQMGFDVAEDDVKAAQNEPTTPDREYRQTIRGLSELWEDDNSEDPAMVRGWLYEEYALVDFDGDGIAERRKVMRLGRKVLLNEEFSHVPIAAWTPYIVTHRFEGLSVADLVEDFQRISTDIMRAQLDNLDLANNQETVVLTDAQGNPQADIDDLLNRRPGGVIREKIPGAVRPYAQRWQGIEAMPMLDALDRMRQNRTGFIPTIEGLDADALNKTATQVSKEANRNQKRMKLMARVMAEALVAPTFRGIFKTLTDYCAEKLSFRLNKQFVQYDPQEWRDGYDMSINVGIGTGDVQQQAMFLERIAQAQFAMLQSPMARLVSEANFYEVHSRIAENAGFKNPGAFFSDPKQLPPPQPPQPDPKTMLEQAKLQFQAQEADKQRQADIHKFQAEAELKQRETQLSLELQAANDQRDAEREAMRAQYEHQLERQRLELDKYKTDENNRTKIIVAQMAQHGSEVDAEGQAVEKPDPMEQFGQIAAMLSEALNRPKQVVRDESGRVVGVQ